MKSNSFFVLFLSFTSLVSAQKKIIAGTTISSGLGLRTYIARPLSISGSNLDFFDNAKSSNENYPTSPYLSFEIRTVLKNGTYFNFLTTSNDDFPAENFDFSIGKFVKPNLGLGVGLAVSSIQTDDHNFKSFFTEFNQYTPSYRYLKPDSATLFEYSENINFNNGSTIYLKSYHTYFNFFLRHQTKKIRLEFENKIGIGFLKNKEFEFGGYLKNSFAPFIVNYSSKPSFFAYTEPSLSLFYWPFKIRKSNFGFQLKSTCQIAKRKFDYTRSISTWTANNTSQESFQGKKFLIGNYEVEFGLIWNLDRK